MTGPKNATPSGGPEVQDRRPDVLAGQRQGLGGLGAELVVGALVVERVGQVRRQTGLGEDRLDERAGVPVLPGQPVDRARVSKMCWPRAA